MAQSDITVKIQDFTENFVQQWPEVFVVHTQVSPGNKITVLLDADNGMNIERCAVVNRALVKWIEEKKVFGEGNYTTEVSSPGIDRPLTILRQFKKNIGRTVQVQRADNTKSEGKLASADEKCLSIILEQKQKHKQSELKTITIPFADIKQVKVLVTF